jgi:hypothetical protein
MTALSTDPTAIETAAIPPPAQVPAVATSPEPEPNSEPQNPLTQKFTEAEWTGVRELRVNILPVYCRVSVLSSLFVSDETP